MCRNLFTLQQTLTSTLTGSREVALDNAKQYYELCNQVRFLKIPSLEKCQESLSYLYDYSLLETNRHPQRHRGERPHVFQSRVRVCAEVVKQE